MKKESFSILKQDLEASRDEDGKYSFNADVCPFKQAFVRQYPQYGNRVQVGYFSVIIGGREDMAIENPFTYEAFERLQSGIEFHTNIIFNQWNK